MGNQKAPDGISDLEAQAKRLASMLKPEGACRRMTFRDHLDVIRALANMLHAVSGLYLRVHEHMAAGYADNASSAILREVIIVQEARPAEYQGHPTHASRRPARAIDRLAETASAMRSGPEYRPLASVLADLARAVDGEANLCEAASSRAQQAIRVRHRDSQAAARLREAVRELHLAAS